ncbi:MAG: response regulator [Deltaproteobacteria bacterium]|nr:response regulator [Deltaproteobacteria bacterium]
MGKRVLIVDDSAFMRKRLRKEIESHDAEVVGEAKNGDDAVELYQKLKPDLVTMDVTMRGKDGLSASKEILSLDPGAKIVVVTILQEDDYKKIASALGVIGFIAKGDIGSLKGILDKI